MQRCVPTDNRLIVAMMRDVFNASPLHFTHSTRAKRSGVHVLSLTPGRRGRYEGRPQGEGAHPSGCGSLPFPLGAHGCSALYNRSSHAGQGPQDNGEGDADGPSCKRKHQALANTKTPAAAR